MGMKKESGTGCHTCACFEPGRNYDDDDDENASSRRCNTKKMRLARMIPSHPTIAGDVVSGLEGYWGLRGNCRSLAINDMAVVDTTIKFF